MARASGVYTRRSHTQVRVATRSEVIAVELLLKLFQALLVSVIIEMVFAMQVLHEGSNTLHHGFWREVVNIALKNLTNLL